MTSRFTHEEKLEAVQRELGYRRRVYPRRIEAGNMSQQLADKQIKLFEEIEADYQKAVEGGRLI